MEPYLHFAQVNRYGILYVVNQLVRVMSKSAKPYREAVKHLLRYLAGFIYFSITSKEGDVWLAAFSDANWGNNADNGRSRSSYIVMLANAPIIYKGGLQGLTAQSTMEAELVAAAVTMENAVFRSNMMSELVFDERFGSVPLYIDNTSALHVTGNRTYNYRAKYIALRYVFVQELVEEGKVSVHYVKSEGSRQTWALSTSASTVTATSSSSSTSLRFNALTSSSTTKSRASSFCATNTCVLLTYFSAHCSDLQRCMYTALLFCSSYNSSSLFVISCEPWTIKHVRDKPSNSLIPC